MLHIDEEELADLNTQLQQARQRAEDAERALEHSPYGHMRRALTLRAEAAEARLAGQDAALLKLELKWRNLKQATHQDFHRCADELASVRAARGTQVWMAAVGGHPLMLSIKEE